MTPLKDITCRVHVLVCTNERTDGRSSCKPLGGQEIFQTLKSTLRAEGLGATHWVTRTGCLGYCNSVGATVKIQFADGTHRWWNEVTPNDIPELLSQCRQSR